MCPINVLEADSNLVVLHKGTIKAAYKAEHKHGYIFGHGSLTVTDGTKSFRVPKVGTSIALTILASISNSTAKSFGLAYVRSIIKRVMHSPQIDEVA